MLDPKFVLENLEKVKKTIAERGMKLDISSVTELAAARIKTLARVEELRAERNKLSKKPSEKSIQRGTAIKNELKNLEPQLKNLEEQLEKILWQIPNLVHPKTPRGFKEQDNKTVRADKPPKPDFKPLDHEQLAKSLDLIDFEAGAAVAGSKFYYLKNEAVLLEFALIKYAFDLLLKEGFTPFVTPDLAKPGIIDGVGFVPRGPESNIYLLEGDDLGLVGTAEITLGGYHAGQILEEKDFPLKYAGFSHCFRREAGSYGQFSKGLYRVHQFSKVEMFLFCRPEESEKMHEYLLSLEEKIFRGLEIPYRVLDIRAGDLGAAAYRKFDLEAWMPGKGDWGEITSTSNTTDYQARRLGIKYRKSNGETAYPHTLNGTAVATSRALIAILENYQKEDGTVEIPKVLIPYVGKKLIRR
ncbi:serine--tRNA ligase [candidate division WWE3 bacterium RIFCSPLOWO2_01_FULL_53_14]|uniref:Serine--tRNA ligase n=1 Tax=candidate division WWE3 bacterium RIFCSPLOWO2_01_FULL_53_14 TaxID=1802628 RepID=A0A1F4VYW0_UNCKA|nr:MAG: serine--tRNA ligase [candidate division WWE3 bacterium RIFCSPLOWO2_01_FULL_53_14]